MNFAVHERHQSCLVKFGTMEGRFKMKAFGRFKSDENGFASTATMMILGLFGAGLFFALGGFTPTMNTTFANLMSSVVQLIV